MVGSIKSYNKDPAGKGRGMGLYYYRGKVKELGDKPYWSKWSEERDVKKRKVRYHKGVFQIRFAHKGDVKHTPKGNK
jgi:hypothetical protein